MKKPRTSKQRDEQLQRQQRWYARNKGQHNTASRLRYLWLRMEVLQAYGGVCECCGESNFEFLCLDHKNGGGNKERKAKKETGGSKFLNRLKREGFPKDRYRLLCHNCNFSYGLLGYCPHQLLDAAP